jgi:oligoribonuclease
MYSMPQSPQHLIWIDLEMTGLDPDNDQILEIATLVTDQDLNELACGPELAITTALAKLEAMDDWNRTHHARSGLWQRALSSNVSLAQAQAQSRCFHAKGIGKALGATGFCRFQQNRGALGA